MRPRGGGDVIASLYIMNQRMYIRASVVTLVVPKKGSRNRNNEDYEYLYSNNKKNKEERGVLSATSPEVARSSTSATLLPAARVA